MTKTLITGSASGIGAAVARQLTAAGHHLILVDRQPQTAPTHRIITGDVADEALWDSAASDLTGLRHAVINAGIAHAAPIADHDVADWRRVMAVNLDGAFLALRAAMRAMIGGSGPRSIVLTASIAGIKAEPGIAAYAASKAALIQLMRVAAKEGAPHGIRVNAVAPGGVDTPIWDSQPFFAAMVADHGSRAAALAALAKMATPLGAYASAEEVAGQIGFLLSEAAASVTGAVLRCDGGYSL